MKNEFPEINKRIAEGLKLYKYDQEARFINCLKSGLLKGAESEMVK